MNKTFITSILLFCATQLLMAQNVVESKFQNKMETMADSLTRHLQP